jgi:hypothetical protein
VWWSDVAKGAAAPSGAQRPRIGLRGAGVVLPQSIRSVFTLICVERLAAGAIVAAQVLALVQVPALAKSA